MLSRSKWLKWTAALAWVGAALMTQAQAAEPLGVFVSILPQKQMVERIGGEAVKVDVLVSPGQSPATYEPSPQQMVALSKAQLYFRIGVPFENTWMPRIQQAHPNLKVVDTRQGITLLPINRHDHAHAAEHGGDAAAAGAKRLDPHIWTSPPLVKQQAATIRDALIAMRPAEKARFDAGYAQYAAELDALDSELRQLLAGKAQRRFMVFHPAWGYLADAYGLQQIPIEVEGKEPSPQALARIIDRAKADGIRVIFVQKQFSRTAAEQVARAIGGEVVAIDPLAEDFVGNMREVGQALARGLK
ncbi:MAG: metal ABC transporter solute-binding protein, Zn/Mn family [Tepidimonas sp.]|uniref:metal ABC transporter solute-binding protein, Zn/Mn family n=1 Tax=Tepidimonas sp. TaxID=2002775 RepID=UPI004054C3D1